MTAFPPLFFFPFFSLLPPPPFFFFSRVCEKPRKRRELRQRGRGECGLDEWQELREGASSFFFSFLSPLPSYPFIRACWNSPSGRTRDGARGYCRGLLFLFLPPPPFPFPAPSASAARSSPHEDCARAGRARARKIIRGFFPPLFFFSFFPPFPPPPNFCVP